MFKEINCHSAEYLFVESLLHSAFPEDERRDDDEQRRYTLDEDKFHTLLVSLDDEPVGLLTYWQFNGYRYIEHFAVSPQKRCGGLGGRIFTTFLESSNEPAVFEVEPPEMSELAKRRIDFYRRMGLKLWDTDYLQPPYRPGGAPLPLRLMASPTLPQEKAPEITATIHRHVYNVK